MFSPSKEEMLLGFFFMQTVGCLLVVLFDSCFQYVALFSDAIIAIAQRCSLA